MPNRKVWGQLQDEAVEGRFGAKVTVGTIAKGVLINVWTLDAEVVASLEWTDACRLATLLLIAAGEAKE